MIGTVIKEQFVRYDFVVLFRADAQPADILNFFSSFFVDKESYFIGQSPYYCGLQKLSYSIRKNSFAHFYSIDLYCMPSKLDELRGYSNRSSLAIRHLLVKNENTTEQFIPLKIKEREEDGPYRELLKSMAS